MKKCQYCGAELAEDSLCPECGKNNAAQEETVAEEIAVTQEAPEGAATEEEILKALDEPTEEPQPTKATPKKIALSVIAIVLLLAIIGGMLMIGRKPAAQPDVNPSAPAFQGTVPADGNPEDVTCKGSYSVTDEVAAAEAETVVASVGECTLTNSQLQVFYWNYVQTYLSTENGYMAMMAGQLDYSQPLDMQVCAENPEMSWQQFFLNGALDNWRYMQALAIEAKAAGYTISEEDRAALEGTPAALESTALQMGYASTQELLTSEFGAGVTLEDYMYFEELYYSSIPYYYQTSAELTVTDEEVEAFFTEHEQEYAALGLLRTDRLVDVRHILIMPEGATNETIRSEVFTEEAWTASEARAQQILQEYLDGEQTEERFAELANTYTQDGNDSDMDGQPDGGLYTGITKETGFVPEFLAWCIDESRVPGDVEIVKTDFGYHIMYFSKGEALYPQYARQDCLTGKGTQLIMDALDRNPITVEYGSICLAVRTGG